MNQNVDLLNKLANSTFDLSSAKAAGVLPLASTIEASAPPSSKISASLALFKAAAKCKGVAFCSSPLIASKLAFFSTRSSTKSVNPLPTAK